MESKNFKQLINEHCQREKVEKAEYVCTPDQEKNPNGFFCTLTVGGQSYCTPNWQKTKKSAELEAAKIACDKLNLQKTNTELKAEKLGSTYPSKINGIKTEPVEAKNNSARDKDPEWITIEKVEDIYKYLTDEVLAQEFKAFLHCKAQEEKKGYPVFNTKDAHPKGFTSTVTYDGKEYQSLGVMMSKKQAEQSAAEVCLRTLGDFPSVPKDKYTIQVYRGGQVHLQARRQERTTKYTHSLLQGFIASLGHQFPQYCYKETESGHEAVCFFEGKMFKSGSADTLIDAKNRAAFEALAFFGFDEKKSKEAGELRDMLRIKHRKSFIPIGVLMSPMVYCPSKRPGWMFYHFQSTDMITAESAATLKDCENMFNIKKWTPLSAEQLMLNIFGKSPAIDDIPLHDRSDISVGEICSSNKNVAIIGNNQCSFRIFCQNGKIRCDNRKCDVELLPGHNIRGLRCSFKLLYPSLQIYLLSESCDDLFYPNPSLPVVTQCGMVVLLFDHESCTQDIQILLTRPSNQKTFATKAKSLASYLNKLISGVQSQSGFDVTECTANIDTWTRNEVKLLSEMTMESLHELMSPYVRYDDRWNEIFAKEHPSVLKELEEAAKAELARRLIDDVEDNVNTDPWLLPHSKFSHRLMQTGVLVENQLMCTFRSLLEKTGLKIKLGELEKSPYVDIPSDDNTNPHRGDAARYCIWTGLRTTSVGEDEMYYKGAEIKKELGEDWVIDEELDRRTARNQKRRQGKEKPRFKKAKLSEGASDEIKKEDPDPTAVEDEKPLIEEQDKTVVEDDEAKAIEETKPCTEEAETTIASDGKRKEREPRNSTAIQEEVRWFPLEEAKALCPLLLKISSTAHFLGQVQSLQTRTNAFLKEKSDGTM